MNTQRLALFRTMERAFRMIGSFQAAVRAQRFADAIEAGDDVPDDYRWYDRGSSEMPFVWKFELGESAVICFPPITVALRRDQLLDLWGLLTQVLFPDAGMLYEATRQLVDQMYDDEGMVIIRDYSQSNAEIT